MEVLHIWMEAEEWAEGEWNTDDANLDVVVTLSDHSRWTATFFTYQNIQSLREKNKISGECLHGAYLWGSNMILIDIASSERICRVISDLIERNEFDSIFTRLEDF
ncbi:hypothetical protein ACTSEZ_01765 [Metabacillus sp. JX24]|uniref:hypothetical protein n=1 Tax=Metabacillus sp. JX24 TaxID=3240759 RepID=UPI00350EE756